MAPAGEAPAEADETTPAPTETIHEAGTAGVDGTPADETTTEATTEPPRERARRRTEPVQVTAAPRPAPSPLQADPVRYGFLTINTMPWSRVFVDGELIGNTPIRRHRVTAGVHEIVLDSPEAGRHTLRVDVAPAEDLRIVRQLAPRGSHRVSPF